MQKTKREIYQVKEQLEQLTDYFGQEKRLQAKLKEFQVKQMWFLDQLKAW